MCETNNPDNSDGCFICGIRQEDSLRMFNEIKIRETDIKTFFQKTVVCEETKVAEADAGKSDIFGKAVYESAYDPGKLFDPPPTVYTPPHDYWND